MDDLLEYDVEENEPPSKKSKQNSQNNQFSLSTYGKQNLSEYSHEESDDYKYPLPLAHLENSRDDSDSVHSFSKKIMRTYESGKHKVFDKERGDLHDDDLALEDNLPESEPLSYDLGEFGVPLAGIPPVSPRLLCEESSHENCSSDIGNCSIVTEVIDLDADDTCMEPCLLLENTFDLDENHSESMNYESSEAQKNENAQESMELDIASTSRGDGEICLMLKSSQTSNFHVPSLEEVLKQIEEQCLKSYGIIPQNGFSLLRLMKDMCECFLAKGTTSIHTENVGPTNVVSSLAISSNPDSQTVPADHQISLWSNSTIPSHPIGFQNLFEVSAEIPRSIRTYLDLSRCKMYLMLQVFMTPERKGWCLRTLEAIPTGAFICEYVGEVVTIKELSERNIQSTGDNQTSPFLLDANWSAEGALEDEEALCIDATVHGNVARFIYHWCFDANLVDILVEVENPAHHYYHQASFTTRKVNAMEELTWDYGIEF